MNKIALKLVVMLLVSSTYAESYGMAKTARKAKVVRAVTTLGKTLWKHKFKTGAGIAVASLLIWQARKQLPAVMVRKTKNAAYENCSP